MGRADIARYMAETSTHGALVVDLSSRDIALAVTAINAQRIEPMPAVAPRLLPMANNAGVVDDTTAEVCTPWCQLNTPA
jgi:hypothetical protein